MGVRDPRQSFHRLILRGAPLLLLLLLCTVAAPLAAQTALGEEAGITEEIEESRRRLNRIQQERTALRDEIRQLETRVLDFTEQVELVSREIDNSNRMLEEINYQLDRYQEQIAETTTELEATRDKLAQRKEDLHGRLRDMYKRGPLQTMRVLLGAESVADLLNRYRYMSLIARHDRQLVAEVEALEDQLLARERELRDALAEVEVVRATRATEHASLETLRGRRRAALAAAQQEQQTTTNQLEQLEEDARQLAALISTLEARRRELEARATAAPAVGTLSESSAGSLGWPVDGTLLYRFGTQPQPNGTLLRWNGIGIAAAEGTDVRAVEGGRAVMAGPFEGYGPTVVLSHGGGYYTLYLYLNDIRVQEGETVARGQIVGSVGGSRTPEGPHIEFQIRAPGGEAVDPLTWLQQRS